ncbi:MAG: cytochrome c-type biogenesis CcmF C-terminal domain-containing protein, partial [Gammaproteobacteria bacterium]
SVRVYYKPFVDWIWGGAFLMGIGGMFAVSDRRYRLASRKRKVKAPAEKVATGELAPATSTPAQSTQGEQ